MEEQTPKKITLTGWLIVLLFLYFFSKTRTGYTLIYYTLLLVLLGLVLTQYKVLQNIIFK